MRHPHGIDLRTAASGGNHLHPLELARGGPRRIWPRSGATADAATFLVAVGLIGLGDILDLVPGGGPVDDVLLLDRVLLLIGEIQLLAVPHLHASTLAVIEVLKGARAHVLRLV